VQTLADYRSTHSELRQMIDDLQAILTPDRLRIRPNAKTACELLCDLGEKVRRHLRDEDCNLYPNLLIHGDPKVTSLAWGLIGDEKPLRATFDNYHARWLRHCDFDFSDEFLAETREIFDLVCQRIVQEERVLIPKLVEIGMFREAHR
jgi:hypothetical protein